MTTEIRVALPTPHPAQQQVIDEAARFNVVACGRRFGKSTLGLNRLIACALEGKPTAWASPTYRQMSETWNLLKHILAGIIVDRSEQEHQLVLRGGGSVDLWSLEDADTVRGRAYALIVVDEAALVSRLEQAWEQVLRPCLTDYSGAAWFLSTPKSLNYFYTLFRRGQDASGGGAWKSWQFPTAANPHLPADEIADAERELPERVYQQEYQARFIEMAGAVFRRVVEAVTPLRAPVPVPKHRHVIGCDWGRTSDATVFIVCDVTDRRIVAVDRFQKVEYHLQLERLRVLVEKFHPSVVVAEKNAIGDPLVEQLERDGLPVYPFLSTNESKRAAIEGLVLAFERGAITDIPEMRTVVHELLAYTAQPLPSGLLRYAAPEGQHDDTVVALMLAWQAASDELEGGPDAVFAGHFDRERHVSEDALEPERGWPVVRGIDISGGVISIVWFQLSRDGKRLRILLEQQTGLSGGIATAKRAMLQSSETLFPGWHFLDVVSAPTWKKGADEAKSAADLFRPELVPQRSDASLHSRLAALEAWLDRQVGGSDAALLIDPRCVRVRRALDGAYRWKSSADHALSDVARDPAASLIDALTYALARLASTGRLDPRVRREIMGPKVLIPPWG
jgi:hypothetical protein